MKTFTLIISSLLISLTGFSINSDSLGMAGDNLDLNAVMELFKNSESVEDFENKLNSDKNEVNNLDLNDDGFVDYIRVIDYADGKTHSLTLQVPFSDAEAQDVAVIEIESTDDNTTIAQIVGDEDLYGENYIVEPQSKDENTAANVNQWKPVRHIYSPTYVIWVSPWRHNYYPKWYKPWKPVLWTVYYGRVKHHHVHYRRTPHFRCHLAHAHYHKHRAHSPAFHSHYYKHHGKHPGKQPVNPKGKQTLNKKSAQPVKSASPKPGTQQNQKSGTSGATQKEQKVQSSPTPKSSTSKPTKRPGATKSKSGGKSGGGKKKP